MSSPRKTLSTLYDHLIWADEATQEAISTLEPGTQEYRDAVVIYAHLAASEEVWLARIEGREADHPVWPDLDLESAGSLAARTGFALKAVARSLESDDGRFDGAGDRVVAYTNSSGNEYRNRLEDVLLHVALHGAYHRGQLAQLVRRGGGEPNPTDYIVHLRRDPAPEQVRPG